MTTKIVKQRYPILLSLLLIPIMGDLTGYDFRQNLTIPFQFNHGSYVLPFFVNTSALISEGKMQGDCADLRFTDTSDSLFSYWIESGCNTGTTLVNPDIQEAITAGNHTILMYYANALASAVSNFNLTFSNEFVPNGNFEGDASGDPEDWTITEAVGSIDVSQEQALVGTNSTKYVDNSGASQPTMVRSFSASSTTTILTFSIYVDFVTTTGAFLRIGGDTGDFAVLSMQLKSDNSIDIFPDGTPTTLNETYNDDEWTNISIGTNFSSGQNSFWINGNFTGDHNFRNLGGAPANMDDLAFQAGGAAITTYYLDAIRIREWETPEPTVFFSEEEFLQSVSLSAIPSTIAFTEQTNLTVQAGESFNLTEFHWTFDDGQTAFTTVPSINHTYLSSGTFNASVIALNVTNNITAFTNVTVISPEVRIWAQDQSNSEFVQNFTINLANSTNDVNLSTTSFFVNFSAEDQPYGDVTLQVFADGFNHTATTFSTISTSLINRTEQLFPAVITLFAVSHQQFFNITASIPADVTFSNSTTAVSFGVVEQEFFNFDCDACSADTISSDIGLFFRYKTEDIGGSAGTATLFLCNQFGGSCQNIRDLSGLDEENYVVIQDDGAWDIRTTSDTSVSTGSINFMPARLKITATVGGGEHVQANITQMSSPYAMCFINAGCPTGNVTIQVSKVDSGIYSRVDAYKDTFITLQDVNINSVRNVTAYFTTATLSHAVKFVTFDTSNQGLLGAKVTVWKQDDSGTLFEISSMFTDGTGSTPFVYFEKDTTIFVLATFADIDSGGIKPIFVSENNLEVNLPLGATSITVDDPAFAGVTVSANPVIDTVRESTFQQFNVTIADSFSQLINTTWNLSDSQATFSFSDSSTSSSGAVFNENVTIPELNGTSNVITMSYTIWRTFEGSPVFTSGTILYSVFPGLNLGNVCDLSDSLSGFKGLLALILVGAAFIVHPLLGGLVLIPLGFWCFVGFDVVAMGLLFSIAMYLGVRQ